MILAELRERTRPQHERLEARLDIFHLAESPERYRAYLGRAYGFYAPVEAALMGPRFADAWWNREAFPSSSWRKLPLLTRDLITLGSTPAEIQRLAICLSLPPLDSRAGALGCLYVLEGATLGGQIISRHLSEIQNLSPERGAAFFYGYGAETGHMWKSFRALLTRDVESGECDPEEVIAAAAETFHRYENWVCAEG